MNKLTQDELIKIYPEPINKKYVIECLQSALQNQDSLAVTRAMTLAYRFNFIDSEMLPVLEELLTAGWHTRNEDIAHELQRIASPTSINPLYYAITNKFGYRDDDDLYTFQVQCIWALGAINTTESKEKLKSLFVSDVKAIRQAAKEQIKSWPVK